MSKRRYDYKKLSRSSSTKKKMALLLAEEKLKSDRMSLNFTEILAYGHRPYVSYSDKELTKIFDDLYSETISKIQVLEEDANHPDNLGKYGRMRNITDSLVSLKLLKEKMQPIVDELIEEAFSE